MRTSLFLVFLISACAVDSSPVVPTYDAVPGADAGGAAGMSGIVGLFDDAQAADAAIDDGDTDAAQPLADGAVKHLKDAARRDGQAPVDAAEPEDADVDAAASADAAPDSAVDAMADADAAPNADAATAADAEPPLDDEGTCDLCSVDADCPPTHQCGTDTVTAALKFCLPLYSYCGYPNGTANPQAIPPFVGGEYLLGHLSSTGCYPKQDGTAIGCAAWRQLVGIPE